MIHLTPLEPADSDVLFRWINCREDVLYNAAYRPVHRDQHDHWWQDAMKRSDAVLFGIRTDAGALIGTCQLIDVHPVHRSAELRIRIGVEAERGRGCGTAALRQLLAFGFRDLNLHRIWLQVFADNSRAVRVYERLGFRREGTLRSAAYLDGGYRDIELFALLRSDYDTTPA